MKNPSDNYDFDAATIERAGEYAKLEVPITDRVPSQDYVNKWVSPFYLTNLVFKFDTFASSYRQIADEIDDQLVTDLLTHRNWRPRITAAYFVAIKRMQKHCDHIGKLLLRSDVCFAGGGYALALARLNNQESVDYLIKYLDHYLRRPDLQFDQADVMGALKYCDEVNGTDYLVDFIPLWDHFAKESGSNSAVSEATDWFEQKMNSICQLAKNSNSQ